MFARSCRRSFYRSLPRNHPVRHRSASFLSRVPPGTRLLAYALIGVGGIGLASGLYTYYQLAASPYPPEVTKHIRKALYYEGAGADPKQAIQCYLQAIEEGTKLDLDQTGDDMTGLKIKVGAVYEHSGRPDSAIRVYLGLLNELQASLNDSRISIDTRTRLLKRALGTSIKLGDLSMLVPHLRPKAESYYTWALEIFLKETASRDGDSSWLDTQTIGALYEEVATFYYSVNRPELALPLYLKSLESLPVPNGRTIIIINNVASAISSQSDADQVQETAEKWASRARDLIVPAMNEEEQAECEFGRCSAMYNLGMIAEKRSRIEDARQHYRAAINKALKLRTPDAQALAAMSERALQRIGETSN